MSPLPFITLLYLYKNMPEIFEALLKPEAYPERPAWIKLIQTHISWVFLTGRYAYKVKKPVDFGFLNFSTLERRKYFCERELELNRLLSPDVYLDVLPITEDEGKIRISGSGKVIEYTVKMLELPQDSLMVRMLERGEVKSEVIEEIARIVADFHKKAESGREIDRYGSIETIRFNWDENFGQTEQFIDKVITKNDFGFVKESVNRFIERNRDIFQDRIRNGRIKWCHGDLHSGNIFITDKIHIFDAIEFNPRIACSDTASDVAFMAMDLDFHGRRDFSEHFVEKYIEHSMDKNLSKLLDFYKCYRAYVRFKVVGFRLSDRNIPEKEKQKAKEEAKKYFELALKYAESLATC